MVTWNKVATWIVGMRIFINICLVEIGRLLALSCFLFSAFCLGQIGVGVFALIIEIIDGDIYGGRRWLEVSAWCVAAFGPAWVAITFPGFAETNFDQLHRTRSPSQREKDVLDRVWIELEAASKRTGLKLPRVVFRIEETGELNAMAYGRNRVAFTRGLLHKHMGTDNGVKALAAVAAHEIGHLRFWDTRFNMVLYYLQLPASFGAGVLNIFAAIPIVGLVATVARITLYLPIDIGHLILQATSQPREYLADWYATQLLGSANMAVALDDFVPLDEWQGGVANAVLRSHPSSELRRDKVLKTAARG